MENDNHILTTKEKIDKVLGITSGASIDEFLSDIDEETNEIQSTFNSIDSDIKNGLEQIDDKLAKINESDDIASNVLEIKDINLSMKEVENLISDSKQIYRHVTESILATDLVDAELINAAAKLLESIHINIAEFISMYRDKQKFVDKIKFAIFQQQQKKEMMLLKHKLELEKIEKKGSAAGDGPIDTTGEVYSFNIDEVIRKMNDKNDEQLDD